MSRARAVRLLLALAVALPVVVGLGPARGAENATLYVNNASPAASDANSGSASSPLRTIQRAVQIADANQLNGVGTTVLIGAGTYRESATFATDRAQTAAIVLQGAAGGGTVVTGSDLWDGGWVSQGAGVYRRPWADNWGLAPAPPEWNAPEIARRREMVFANGALLRQHLTSADLTASPGGFHVDESSDGLFVKLPGAVDPNAAVMEVGRRGRLLFAEKRHNITLRNLTFQHAVSPLQYEAVAFPGSSDIVIEDSRFLWNNWAGLNFYGFEAPLSVDRVTLRRVDASHNGSVGITTYRLRTFRVYDSTTNGNAWRISWGSLWFQHDGGMKMLRNTDWVIDGHKAVDNYGMGIWHDIGGVNGTIRNTVARGNGSYGIFLEANPGPMLVENAKVCGNGTIGVTISQSEGTTLRNNQIFGNATINGQLTFTGVNGGRWVDGTYLHNRSTTLTGNTIVGNSNGINVIESTLDNAGWNTFASTLSASGNSYWSPTRPEAFNWHVAGAIWRGNYDFATWRASTGQDTTSSFAPPAVSLACDLQPPVPAPTTTTTTMAPSTTTTKVAAPTTTTVPGAATTTTIKQRGKKK